MGVVFGFILAYLVALAGFAVATPGQLDALRSVHCVLLARVQVAPPACTGTTTPAPPPGGLPK